MTFNVAADLTKLDKDELYALQANLERESTDFTRTPERLEVLRAHLARVDSEILSRSFLARRA